MYVKKIRLNMFLRNLKKTKNFTITILPLCGSKRILIFIHKRIFFSNELFQETKKSTFSRNFKTVKALLLE